MSDLYLVCMIAGAIAVMAFVAWHMHVCPPHVGDIIGRSAVRK